MPKIPGSRTGGDGPFELWTAMNHLSMKVEADMSLPTGSGDSGGEVEEMGEAGAGLWKPRCWAAIDTPVTERLVSVSFLGS